MNNKLSSFIDYVSLILKKYNEIQKTQMRNTFRVASIKKHGDDIKIIFQVIGKSTFMECTPLDILSNDAFIEQFSRRDIQKITHVHAQNSPANDSIQKSSDLKLIQQEFNIHAGKTNFTLRDKDGNTSSKTAAEIITDQKLVRKLTQQDAMSIGYIAGYEHSQNDGDHNESI